MSVQTAIDPSTHFAIEQFLYREARLLDTQQIREWFSLISDDIEYKVPVRVTKERAAGPGFSSSAFHMDEDWGMLEVRVTRLETEYAWAEDPPSRTRRFVTNVQASQRQASDEFDVLSNLLVFRNRYDTPAYQLIAGERVDVVRAVDDDWQLARRTVYLDQSTLGTHNLAIFL